MVEPKANVTLDLRDTLSPLSLLKVSHLFRGLDPGEVMEIRGCNAAQQEDLARLLPDADFDVAAEGEPERGSGCLRVRIRKLRAPDSTAGGTRSR